jgi:large subunit ribosomal protein L3
MIGSARKVGMTRLFINGLATPVTALHFDDQFVVQRKTTLTDGYNAIQIASYMKSKKHSSRARLAHITKYTGKELDFHNLSEYKVDLPEDKTTITISDFAVGDLIDVTGTSKGKGFTGAVKRWGFAGQPKSHGSDHERAVGSIGARWPQRTVPGKKMAGRSGNAASCVKKAKIIAIDVENKLIFVNGSVAGANSYFVKLQRNN